MKVKLPLTPRHHYNQINWDYLLFIILFVLCVCVFFFWEPNLLNIHNPLVVTLILVYVISLVIIHATDENKWNIMPANKWIKLTASREPAAPQLETLNLDPQKPE